MENKDQKASNDQEAEKNQPSQGNESHVPSSDQVTEEPPSEVFVEVQTKVFGLDDAISKQPTCPQTSETPTPVESSPREFDLKPGEYPIPVEENSAIIYSAKKDKCLGNRVYEGRIVTHDIVRNTITQDKLAVKLRTINSSLSKEEIDKQYYNEIENSIKLLAHVNVARYVRHLACYLLNEPTVVIVTDLCNPGKLEKHLLGFSIEGKIILLVQLCHGLKHIHMNQIAHRDLKPSNVLLSLDGKHIKIIDFGISKEFALDENNTITKSSGFSGTLGWVAPEMCSDDRSKEFEAWVKADIYSLGLLIYFIFTDGKHPYQGDANDKHQSIKNKKRPDFSVIENDKEFHDRYLLIDLLRAMLSHEPDDRPAIREILQHCFTWNDEKKMNFIHVCHKHFEQPYDHDPKLASKKSRKALNIIGTVEQKMAYFDREIKKEDKSLDTHSRDDDSEDSVQFDRREEAPKDNDEPERTEEEKKALERIFEIIGEDWVTLIKEKLEDPNSGNNQRPYENSFTDLVRYIRNSHEHFEERPEKVKSKLGSKNEGMWKFFASKFPEFFSHSFDLMKDELKSDVKEKYLQEEAKSCELP
ncbi:uncharacterized protein LOC144424293 isoform X2 [Styela clava]